jgi:putative transposase
MDVSRSGYYAYALRRASPHARDTALVLHDPRWLSNASRGSYGSRRIARELQAQGHAVGRYRARRWIAGRGR